MNQFKEWGFSAQWWRGEKGEYWVFAQVILFVGFMLLPVYPAIALDNLSPIWKYADWGITGIFGLVALLLLLSGSIKLGTNLTPLPHPKDDGELVTGGVYALVRHPIYSGVIFLAIAYSCWKISLSHAIGAIVLLLFFDIKARKEESWLSTKFADYDQYRSQVKKLIPWIY
ncbi:MULTISPECIES: methyltransferase family protein [Pseudanabaena]|uniref:methyltransferase family protein n=1 Tax=Pseudanabaena TaxID=1152 RepID=UPI00247A9F0C|nr:MULTISPECIES: isoprenylcysteine carboxylmethyltransferase family protein [Pseudanabaena]MEA5486701.1 isoprenylcysteine carboxylmethyltransferase family protein [Pseudanabaena sp. CCNP1317]WGS73524.1 isoprenylcysteine carboxylmethyltransferase family protein [Pseudanabaena galeata CCNP1313]